MTIDDWLFLLVGLLLVLREVARLVSESKEGEDDKDNDQNVSD
jgi:hypothetical protein